ncbi:MAG: threonine/serine dehydratase [bacterium]|nr:threonine/serine dehydratase [bacterium]
MTPTLIDIQAAAERLRPYLQPTRLESAPPLRPKRPADAPVWLKLENTQPTHAFKVRGALNALLARRERGETAPNGVIAASTGNHAQGVAWAANIVGVPATIVMPSNAARRKVANVRRLGARIIMVEGEYGDAEAEAHRLADAEGRAWLSPYNDPDVIAGGGTCGLEMLAAAPTLERIIVPIGGGGLISGIATAAKALKPSIEVIGVNAAASPEMYNSFYHLNLPESAETIADSLPGAIEAGSLTREIVQAQVDRVLLASEHDLARAVRWLAYEAGWVVEGGGAAGAAVLISGAVAADRETAVVLSGGNIDADVLHRALCE